MLSLKYSLLAILITLINLILYKIFQDNLVFGTILFITNILLYFSYIKGNLITNFLFFILLGILILISLNKSFDDNLFQTGALERDKLAARHEYFANEFGRLYKNKIPITYATSIRPVVVKFNKNLFSHLDFNLFFNTKNAVSLLLVPLFMLGIFHLSKKITKLLFVYLSAVFLTGGFLSAGGMYGYLLYVPFINLVIYLGLLQAVNISKAFLKRNKTIC